MRYLDGEELLVIHARIIEMTGGIHGVQDVHLLASILKTPRQTLHGKPLYSTAWQKATVYLERLAKFHVFVDGNKRTAMAAAARFLFLNGYSFVATNAAVESFVLGIVTKKLDVTTITAWLKRHTRKTRKITQR